MSTHLGGGSYSAFDAWRSRGLTASWRPVAGPAKALGVDQGFCRQEPMAVHGLPIGTEASEIQGSDPQGEILKMGMGQDEKAAVVGDELKALILQERGPADKTVSRPALEGRRRPAKQGKPLSGALGHIAQRLPHPVREAQVVMPAHQLFPSLPLPRENRPNDDFLQEALMDPLKFHTRRLTHLQEQSPEKNEKTSITTTYLKHWRGPAHKT